MRLPVYVLLALAACANGPDEIVVRNASVTTAEDTPATFTIDVSNTAHALSAGASAPAHGTVAINGLAVTYMPATDYFGDDNFDLIVYADPTHTATAHVDVVVTPVDDAPVATNDSFAATEDEPFIVTADNVLANDKEVDGDTLTVTQVGAATHGTVILTPPTITFMPSANYAGMASFEYTMSDGTSTSTATVKLAIGGINDAPTAVDDSAITAEDVPCDLPVATLLANDTDIDGQTPMFKTIVDCTHCTAYFNYGDTIRVRPDRDFNGIVTMTYAISDGVLTDTAAVNITVTPVNDAPKIGFDGLTTPEDQSIDIALSSLLANDVDVDGDPITITDIGNPSQGSIVVSNGVVTFTPAPNYYGTAGFYYTISDGQLSTTGFVAVDVGYVNDPPVAVDDATTAQEDTTLDIWGSTLVANDTDIDCCSLLVTAVGNAVHGTVILEGTTIRFTPAPNFNGTASFDYTVSDGTAADTATVIVSVTPVDDPPAPQFDTFVATEDTPLQIPVSSLLANDLEYDGQPLTVTAASLYWSVDGASVSLSNGIVTVVPAPNDDNYLIISYTVSDGALQASQQAQIQITPVNDPPVAMDDAVSTAINTPLTITTWTLMSNDHDIDSGITVLSVGNAVNGSVSLVNGTITFTPDVDFTGTASFEYTLSDYDLTDVGTVTVTVN